jgi:hypothetical protein
MPKKITQQHIKKFKELCTGLTDLLDQIHEINPEACYYLANDTLHLMKGPDHDDNCRALRSNSVASEKIPYSGGGDW